VRVRRPVIALLALIALGAVAAAGGAQSPPAPTTGSPQTFFRDLLLADPATKPAIVDLLRDGGFVNPRVRFADLTGDGRADAVVRVSSAGSAGDVALYVFSADGAADGKLRAVYRKQALYRIELTISDTDVIYRVPRYATGDELCCPHKLLERTAQWDADRKVMKTTDTREVDRTDAEVPTAPAPPSG
jgi:hypothetical protein